MCQHRLRLGASRAWNAAPGCPRARYLLSLPSVPTPAVRLLPEKLENKTGKGGRECGGPL